jgi:N-acetylglutamate synthase-like GNAT family acetyltransferase
VDKPPTFSIREAASHEAPGVMSLLTANRSAGVLLPWRGMGIADALARAAIDAAARAGCRRIYLFSTGAGEYWRRLGFQEVPVPELVAALPETPQVRHYTALGWLPTEVAWRRDVS